MEKPSIDIDNNLLNRLRDDDEVAFAELYDRYWQQLFLYAYNVNHNKELCEEILQDVFLSLWGKRKSLLIHDSLRSYLFTSVRYQVFRFLKRKENKINWEALEKVDIGIYHSSPESKMIDTENLRQLENLVENLPSRCRQVFRLSREKQLSNKEISNQLNISQKTVENHMTKALFALKSALKTLSVLLSIFF